MIRAFAPKPLHLAKLKEQLSSGWPHCQVVNVYTGLHRSVLVSGNISAIRRFSVSLRQIQEVYKKRASLLTLTLIGAFSAIQAAGRLIIRYHQPAADWLGKIKVYGARRG